MLRAIPSVDRVLQSLDGAPVPRPALLALARRELADLRRHASTNGSLTPDAILGHIRAAVDDLAGSRIQAVVNGTGIIVHTNFGRSPLGENVVRAMSGIASNYNTLEYDLSGGSRGGRAAYLEHNLAVLCGAQAATVVNNCAAALVLILRHFVTPLRPQVVISRGELVQIGGGFRIPEILESSGASLREIGTTNKTSIGDYSRAIGKQTAMVLRVHRSNFYMDGFVDSATTRDIAQIARKKRVLFVEDLGSGAVYDLCTVVASSGSPAAPPREIHDFQEPTPAETLRAGADLVCFSGDKLLGGPQAGIIAGKSKLVSALKRNALFRALRCDKLILSGLQEIIDQHLRGDHDAIPILRMTRTTIDELTSRAQRLIESLPDAPLKITIGKGEAQIGGGSSPRTTIPSVTLDASHASTPPQALAAKLRQNQPPVIGYVSGGKLRLDLRTIFPRQDAAVGSALRSLAQMPGPV